MVGILIGLLVVAVIYNMLSVAEGYKRSTTGAADAQITGLISQFAAGQDAANGGNGVSSGYSDLINCHKTEGGAKYTADTTLKPIGVIITAGATADDPDSFVSRQGASPHVVWPVAMRPLDGATVTMPAGSDIQVQSPNGFMTPAKAALPTVANPFWAVAIANDGTGRCGLISVNNVVAATVPPMDDSGEVVLKQGTPATSIAYTGVAQNALGTGALLLNLGRTVGTGAAQRIRYDVSGDQLRTTNCMYADGCANAGATPNPIAQNVVWMKAQYGIDQGAVKADGSLRGMLDCWTTADNNTPTCQVGGNDWSPATLVKAGDPDFAAVPANLLNRIVAVRLGFVVRSDEYDPRNPAVYRSGTVMPDGTTTGTRVQQYLFNCPANTDAGCPNRVPIPVGADTPGVVMKDGFRYRTYETVIPLRNTLYSATAAP